MKQGLMDEWMNEHTRGKMNGHDHGCQLERVLPWAGDRAQPLLSLGTTKTLFLQLFIQLYKVHRKHDNN
jgi:hypothetical protein